MNLLNAIQVNTPIIEASMKQEIILLFVGGFIAILSSIATLLVTNLIDKHGNLKIYKKIVYTKDSSGDTWGFFERKEGLVFQIPLWIEIQNTSNSVQVIRNLNAWLYKSNNEICSMVQVNRINDAVIANNGNYSFVVEPRSIQKYDCHFTIKKKDVPNDSIFDEVKLAYFDAKDKRKVFHLIKVNDCWIQKKRVKDNDWTLLSQ